MANKEVCAAMEDVRNRLARNAGHVRPEVRDDRNQDELFTAYTRVANIAGEFGHVVKD
jgi:hypothetical protein